MKKYHVYLAGAITGLTFDQSVDWREIVKKSVPHYIETMSPLRGKDYLATMLKNNPIGDCYDFNSLSSEKGINVRDYNDVKRSDAIFVNLLGTQRVSIGTVMEIAWARAFQIPSIVVMEKTGNLHDHCMIRYSSGFIVETIEEGIEMLKVLLATDQLLDKN